MKVLIRCDAGRYTGLGHLSRCITLAESFKNKNIDSFFLIKSDEQALITSFLEDKSIISDNYLFLDDNIKESDDVKTVIEHYNTGFSFLILDHYNHDCSYYKSLKKASIRWAQFDYSASSKIISDVVINANISAEESDYSNITKKDTKLCVGYQYAIINKSIINQPAQPQKNRVLISMGGGVLPSGHREMIKTLFTNKSFVFDLVTRDVELKEIFKEYSNCKIHTNPKNVASIYSNCEAAIVAGGVTTFELAYLNIPMIIVPFADNQLPNATAWDKSNFAMSFDNSIDFKESVEKTGLNYLIDNLKEKHSKKNIIIDGLGSARIVKAISNL